MSDTPELAIYQLKVVLLGISPMIWRRLLVCGDSTITDLHYILQIAMGWSVDHLHQFRIHVHTVAQRIDAELGDEQVFFIDGCERDWEQLPRPGMPLTVGLDGGYVHSISQSSCKKGWFEVIAGKRVTDDGISKQFAFVNNYD